MRNYIIRRLLILIPTLLVLTLLIFILVSFVPGDIVDAMQARSSEMSMDREAIEKALGLDAPLIVQYGRWLGVVPNVEGKVDGLFQGNLGQVPHDGLNRDTPKVKALAARGDGRRDLVRIGRDQRKDHVGRWFFQGLEQCVEGRLGEHVGFVEHIDLVLPFAGPEANLFPDVADLIDEVKTIDGQAYRWLDLPDYVTTKAVGEPRLPAREALIAVPPGADIAVAVRSLREQILGCGRELRGARRCP